VKKKPKCVPRYHSDHYRETVVFERNQLARMAEALRGVPAASFNDLRRRYYLDLEDTRRKILGSIVRHRAECEGPPEGVP
jgi:hypothetical protein